MNEKSWKADEIRAWVDTQDGPNYWYQTIPIKDDIVTPGTVDSTKRLRLLTLSDDLTGKTVLDVGCNSGMLCFECKKRNAKRVVGIDLQNNRLAQARTLANIMDLDIEFRLMDLSQVIELGQFDIVFCTAVITELPDIIGALQTLKETTRETLYLELATMESFPRNRRIFGINVQSILDLNLNYLLNRFGPRRFRQPQIQGQALLRRVQSKLVNGWSLVPNERFLASVMGDQFAITNLGMSVRYELFRITRITAKADCDANSASVRKV